MYTKSEGFVRYAFTNLLEVFLVAVFFFLIYIVYAHPNINISMSGNLGKRRLNFS